ncbi:MAG: hypothetical protein ABI543_00045 [Ignavibacteria bacterium]
MKILIKYHIKLFLILALAVLFNSCSDSTAPIISNESNPLKGAYILYYSPATGSDYAYYDAAKDSVTNFVFTSNNPGLKLNVNPGEMKLNSDRKLYITTLGIPGSNGTIYKIEPESNGIIDSLRFGASPDGFAINNNRIVVANSGSTNVTILDLDFNIINNTITVGPDPKNVLYGFNKYIVSRIPGNTEPSLALIDEINNNVTKLFYPAVPVSAIYNVNGIFVSTNNNKNIYRIDSESFATIDSFAVPTIFSSVNKLVFKSQNSFYAITDGGEVWLATVSSGTFTFTNIMQASIDVSIRAAAYESYANELYLTSESFSGGNTLFILNGDNGTVKRLKSFAGNNTKSIVFRYF